MFLEDNGLLEEHEKLIKEYNSTWVYVKELKSKIEFLEDQRIDSSNIAKDLLKEELEVLLVMTAAQPEWFRQVKHIIERYCEAIENE